MWMFVSLSLRSSLRVHSSERGATKTMMMMMVMSKRADRFEPRRTNI